MSPYLMNGFGIGGGLLNISKKTTLTGTDNISAFGGPVYSIPTNFDDSASSANVGLTMSYAMVPRMSFGFTGDLTFSQVSKLMGKLGDDSYGFLRPAANLAYGGARNFYGFVGVNTAMFTGEPTFNEGHPLQGEKVRLQSQFGWQAGAGYLTGSLKIFAQYSSSKVKVDESYTKDKGIFHNAATLDGGIDLSGLEVIAQYGF